MNIFSIENTEIVVLENVFLKNEIEDIWKELEIYSSKNIFLDSNKTGSAKNSEGSVQSKKSGIFLDSLYSNDGRNISSILSYTENNLLSLETKQYLQEANNIYGMLKNANCHFTLLNYYENSDYYDFHIDKSVFSILTYIFKEPKNFSGGNIIFKKNKQSEEIEIEVKSNISIFFPSFYLHKVTPIQMNENDSGKMMGRFSIAQFIHINYLSN